jgi:hypothetical protein
VQDRIDAQLGELAPAVARLDAIPGVGPVAAKMIPAEIGTDTGRFPTPAHLTSWARFPPGFALERPTMGHAGDQHRPADLQPQTLAVLASCPTTHASSSGTRKQSLTAISP